jgi:hypothetical protein
LYPNLLADSAKRFFLRLAQEIEISSRYSGVTTIQKPRNTSPMQGFVTNKERAVVPTAEVTCFRLFNAVFNAEREFEAHPSNVDRGAQ